MIQLDPKQTEICIPRRVCKELQCSWVIYVGTTANFKSLRNMMEYCRTIKFHEKTNDDMISSLTDMIGNKSRNYNCFSSDNDRSKQKRYSISVTRPVLNMNDNSDCDIHENNEEDDADQILGVNIDIGVLQDH